MNRTDSDDKHLWLPLPVLEALQAGQINLTYLRRNQRAPLKAMQHSPLPVLTWIADNDDLSCGPTEWLPALAAAHWTKGVMIDAGGAQARHYELLVVTTLIAGRMLMVETTSRHVTAWEKLLYGRSVLTISPSGMYTPNASAEDRQ